jgi:hypothetical protein
MGVALHRCRLCGSIPDSARTWLYFRIVHIRTLPLYLMTSSARTRQVSGAKAKRLLQYKDPATDLSPCREKHEPARW